MVDSRRRLGAEDMTDAERAQQVARWNARLRRPPAHRTQTRQRERRCCGNGAGQCGSRLAKA
eukprot:1673746-Rhodomonas_salina.1